jgi:hypothetical protein
MTGDGPAAEVLRAERALQAAMRASDVEALDRLLHPDLLAVGPDGAMVDKALTSPAGCATPARGSTTPAPGGSSPPTSARRPEIWRRDDHRVLSRERRSCTVG